MHMYYMHVWYAQRPEQRAGPLEMEGLPYDTTWVLETEVSSSAMVTRAHNC